MKNANVQTAIKVATIAGSAILVVSNATKLTGVSSVRGAVMPLVSIMVGVAAFKYASSQPTLKKA